MVNTRKRFGEDIDKLRSRRDEMERNEASKELLMNKMAVNLHMFGSFMENGVFGDVDYHLTVRVKRHWKNQRNG